MMVGLLQTVITHMLLFIDIHLKKCFEPPFGQGQLTDMFCHFEAHRLSFALISWMRFPCHLTPQTSASSSLAFFIRKKSSDWIDTAHNEVDSSVNWLTWETEGVSCSRYSKREDLYSGYHKHIHSFSSRVMNTDIFETYCRKLLNRISCIFRFVKGCFPL